MTNDTAPKRSGLGGLILAGILIAGTSAAFWLLGSDDAPDTVSVVVPDTLSETARAGQAAFNATCATCHGKNAAGGTGGPPLIHKIYEPGHHADGAVRNAVKLGVRQHHWSFGNMPPQPNVSDEDVAAITVFLRETQRANGIE